MIKPKECPKGGGGGRTRVLSPLHPPPSFRGRCSQQFLFQNPAGEGARPACPAARRTELAGGELGPATAWRGAEPFFFPDPCVERRRGEFPTLIFLGGRLGSGPGGRLPSASPSRPPSPLGDSGSPRPDWDSGSGTRAPGILHLWEPAEGCRVFFCGAFVGLFPC